VVRRAADSGNEVGNQNGPTPTPGANDSKGSGVEVMSATAALVELVRDALRDPSIRDEIKAIVSTDQGSTAVTAENEPLIDAHAAGKLLGMSPAAVRAAAFRGTLPSHHIGRLLRFRSSELLPGRRPPSRAR